MIEFYLTETAVRCFMLKAVKNAKNRLVCLKEASSLCLIHASMKQTSNDVLKLLKNLCVFIFANICIVNILKFDLKHITNSFIAICIINEMKMIGDRGGDSFKRFFG